jgi:hypothetical protein
MAEHDDGGRSKSTQTRTSLNSMIGMLEAAREGSHRLDAELVMRLDLPCETAADEEGAMYQRIGADQKYTRSLDAARSWTPEGWLLSLHESVHGWEATLQNRHMSQQWVKVSRPAPTAPLAVCIANAMTMAPKARRNT